MLRYVPVNRISVMVSNRTGAGVSCHGGKSDGYTIGVTSRLRPIDDER